MKLHLLLAFITLITLTSCEKEPLSPNRFEIPLRNKLMRTSGKEIRVAVEVYPWRDGRNFYAYSINSYASTEMIDDLKITVEWKDSKLNKLTYIAIIPYMKREWTTSTPIQAIPEVVDINTIKILKVEFDKASTDPNKQYKFVW